MGYLWSSGLQTAQLFCKHKCLACLKPQSDVQLISNSSFCLEWGLLTGLFSLFTWFLLDSSGPEPPARVGHFHHSYDNWQQTLFDAKKPPRDYNCSLLIRWWKKTSVKRKESRAGQCACADPPPLAFPLATVCASNIFSASNIRPAPTDLIVSPWTRTVWEAVQTLARCWQTSPDIHTSPLKRSILPVEVSFSQEAGVSRAWGKMSGYQGKKNIPRITVSPFFPPHPPA